jgi:transcriptional regulator
MYQPPHHREDRLDVQHALIESHPLGLLISNGPDDIVANAIPFLLRRGAGPKGTLLAHLARANTQWQSLDGQKVLVVFQGPQAYISPSNYATKQETGKVVPTWNYAIVQARGIARVHGDTDWLDQQIEALTNTHESERAHAWAVSDAPRPYIESQMRGIIGVGIEIAAIEGKWKVSQNRQEADRRGVAEGLARSHEDMAALVRLYGGV